MDNIELILKNIEPIIMNCRKVTKIPSWEIEDYMQEGMIIALEMYNDLDHNILKKDFNFYVYFKVRYSCFLIDALRKASAFKRKFDQPIYIDIAEAFNIYDHKQDVEQNVCYKVLCQEIIKILTPEERSLLITLKNGGKVERNKKYRLKKKIVNYINRLL